MGCDRYEGLLEKKGGWDGNQFQPRHFTLHGKTVKCAISFPPPLPLSCGRPAFDTSCLLPDRFLPRSLQFATAPVPCPCDKMTWQQKFATQEINASLTVYFQPWCWLSRSEPIPWGGGGAQPASSLLQAPEPPSLLLQGVDRGFAPRSWAACPFSIVVARLVSWGAIPPPPPLKVVPRQGRQAAQDDRADPLPPRRLHPHVPTVLRRGQGPIRRSGENRRP